MMTASPALKPGTPSLKRSIVHQMQRGLYLSGLAWAYRKMADPEGALIIMYHSVVDERNAAFIDEAFSVTTEQFEAQLRYLKRNANVISVSEMVDCIYGERRLPERAVVLTFDDGYLNNLTHAAPLLKKYDMPAMIYLCTGYIDRKQSQWDDVLYSTFQFRTSQKLTWQGRDYDLSDAATLRAAFGELGGQMIVADIDERDRILEAVTAQLRPGCDFPQLTMSWDDVRSLAANYPDIELGLHTADHLDVSRLTPEQLEAEIGRAQETFTRELGHAAEHFSYPYGRHTERVAEQLRAMGLKSAVITQPTALVTSSTNPFMMPRYEISSSLLDLRLWMSGAFPDLAEKVMHRVYD